MPSKNVEWEISIQGLSVKFKGDILTAGRMHGEVAGALTSLATAQQRLIGTSMPPPAAAVVVEQPARRPRRRRRSTPTESAGEGVPGAEGETVANDDGRAQSRRAQIGALVGQLKQETFFNGAKRTLSDVRDALSKKGHNFPAKEVSAVLLTLTQDEVLERDKDPGLHQWVYFAKAA
jgi:hypothetical protein